LITNLVKYLFKKWLAATDTQSSDEESDLPERPEKDAIILAHKNAETSLEQTIDAIQDIDETAMVTLRIDLIIIGLILTGATSFPSILRFGNWLSILGFISIIISAGSALITNIGSDYPTGVSKEYLEDLENASWTEKEWSEWMVSEHKSWLEDAGEMASGDAMLLAITQLLLGVGAILLISGVAVGAFGIMEAPAESLRTAGNQSIVI